MKTRKFLIAMIFGFLLILNLATLSNGQSFLQKINLTDLITTAYAGGEDCWEYPEDTGYAMFTQECPPNSQRMYYDRCEPCWPPQYTCNVSDQTVCNPF